MQQPPAPRHVLIVQGHPDPAPRRLCRGLAAAYAEGAAAAGHATRTIDIAELDFPILRSQADWVAGSVPSGLRAAQAEIAWARHLVFFFPLWMGDMPALMKAFLEQVARPGFALRRTGEGRGDGADDRGFGRGALGGRSARVVVTMGMPALVYRYYFRAHSVRSLERNILGLVGIAPVHETLVGSVEALGDAGVRRWCEKMRRLGARAD